MVAAFVFLLGWAAPIVWPDLPPIAAWICADAVTATWIAFAVDLGVRLVLAPRKWEFIRTHPLDIAGVILPVLRPLRLLRLIPMLSFAHRAGTRNLRGRVVTYAIGGTALLGVCAALAVTEAERGQAGSDITNVGTGLWWAFTTMSTVGYGDVVPVTTTGRVVAVALMAGGVALLGVVTATLASWLVERVADDAGSEQAATRAQVEALRAEVGRLMAELERGDQASASPVVAGAGEEVVDS